MNVSELTYYAQQVSEYFKRHETLRTDIQNGNWLIVHDDANRFRAICQDFETQEKIQVIDLEDSGTLPKQKGCMDEERQSKIIQLYPKPQ
ncbi:MAG: hypothetical protein M1378_00160 [Bacteroidetes bacterium]|nr:hypothetical protein [Bacteroidota bacterium]